MTSITRSFLAQIERLRDLVWGRNLLTEPDQPGYPPRRAVSIWIRQVDAGSCHDAELEIAALLNPRYDIERYGLHLVASPRHADLLLLTGPLCQNMLHAVRAAFEAMPEPRRIVTVGDAAGFAESGGLKNECYSAPYAAVPLPEDMVKCIVGHVPGDPPTPQDIIKVLLVLAARWPHCPPIAE